ncbi:hypothetical protein [Verrucosispora sioxanthis]|uniref:hypothetical protein n=1 Tax=Verrucosispora sioxanthis TaxID=2499994 RepID=UPI00359F5F53
MPIDTVGHAPFLRHLDRWLPAALRRARRATVALGAWPASTPRGCPAAGSPSSCSPRAPRNYRPESVPPRPHCRPRSPYT